MDTGVIAEMGEAKEDMEDGEPAMDVTPELSTEPSVMANQRAMKTLFGEDDREISEESDVIPTLEPLPAHEVSERLNKTCLTWKLGDLQFVFVEKTKVGENKCGGTRTE